MRIQFLREKMGLSRKDLAEILNTSSVTIYRWETGVFDPPLQQLRVMSQLFNTSIDDIVRDPQKPTLDEKGLIPGMNLHATRRLLRAYAKWEKGEERREKWRLEKAVKDRGRTGKTASSVA